MLGPAGFGTAYHAQPSVKTVSHARIDHAHLTARVYVQGYAVGDPVVA